MNSLDQFANIVGAVLSHRCHPHSFGFQIPAGASRSPIPKSPPVSLTWRRTLPSGPFPENTLNQILFNKPLGRSVYVFGLANLIFTANGCISSSLVNRSNFSNNLLHCCHLVFQCITAPPNVGTVGRDFNNTDAHINAEKCQIKRS